jgi:hypothetical protein
MESLQRTMKCASLDVARSLSHTVPSLGGEPGAGPGCFCYIAGIARKISV